VSVNKHGAAKPLVAPSTGTLFERAGQVDDDRPDVAAIAISLFTAVWLTG
jgi:hypothetical protein